MDPITPKRKTVDQLGQDLIDSMRIIRSSIDLYRRGQKEAFKTISSQLRVLLCDSNHGRDNSLLRKLYPDPKFHPLTFQMPEPSPGSRIIFAVSGEFSSDSNRLTEIFDTSKPPMPLSDWLDQRIFDPTISIGSLVRSVANKLGSHVDSELNDLLQKTSAATLNNDTSHSLYLVEIAEYVVDQIDSWIVKGPDAA